MTDSPSSAISRRDLLATTGAMLVAGTPLTRPGAAPSPVAAGRFAGKVVLITGATSGIGKATAEAFAAEGAKVVFCGRRQALGEQVAAGIREAGGSAKYIHADVTVPGDITALVDATVKEFGRIDVAHNNAGIEGRFAFIEQMTLDRWDEVINTNLRGVLLSMQAEIAQMRKQGGGSIINTASVNGFIGSASASPYVASKHGVLGLTKVAALECASLKIRVNAVCPGPIDTPMMARLLGNNPANKQRMEARVPEKRLGKPDEIARTVMWLASDDSSYVTGSAVTVDGGLMSGG
ncbi:MAG: glucose 1-dehydrogenase [Gemmatimonadota bacterium]